MGQRGRKKRPPEFYRERDRATVTAYESGQTLQQIAEHQGVTREWVRQVLTRAGIERRKRGSVHHCTPACDEIIRRLTAGQPLAIAAREMGIHSWTAISIQRRHNLRGRPVMHRCRVCPQVLSLYADGIGTPEISKRIGLSMTRIVALLKRHGVTLRPVGYFKGSHCPRYRPTPRGGPIMFDEQMASTALSPVESSSAEGAIEQYTHALEAVTQAIAAYTEKRRQLVQAHEEALKDIDARLAQMQAILPSAGASNGAPTPKAQVARRPNGRPRRLTDKLVAEIRAYYKQGHDMNECAKKFGFHPSTLYRFVNKEGVR